MKKDFSKITFSPKDTIRAAIAGLNRHDPNSSGIPGGIALVTESGILRGIATDGDIRKGIGQGVDLEAPISSIMNPKPLTVEGPLSHSGAMAALKEKLVTRTGKGYVEKLVIVDVRGRVIDIVSGFNLLQTSDARFKRVGIVGLGYVGLTLGATLADMGFRTVGFDTNKKILDGLMKGRTHVLEQGLPELLKVHVGKNFIPAQAIHDETRCDVYVLAVGTPVDREGIPDLSQIQAAARFVGKGLKKNDLVILRSTVPMGTTRGVVIPILEKESGLTAGEDFLVSFAPERTIEGKALAELRSLPQVVGGLNHASAELTSNIFSFLTKSVVTVDSLEEAEMVKLVNNTYRDVTFSFANELSLIARAWGLNAKRVIEAANYGYERSRVPLPSPGVGGYCLTKDPLIFTTSARERGYEPELFKVARRVSSKVVSGIAEDTLKFIKKNSSLKGAKVLVLGFAFKGRPATSDVRGSTTYELIDILKKKGIKAIFGFDPHVEDPRIEVSGATVSKDLEKDIRGADAVIVMTNSEYFESVPMAKILSLKKTPTLLFDCWSLYSPDAIAKAPAVTHARL